LNVIFVGTDAQKFGRNASDFVDQRCEIVFVVFELTQADKNNPFFSFCFLNGALCSCSKYFAII
jgi:hypothetical protein